MKKGEFFGPIILFEEQCKIAPDKFYFLASKFWKSVAEKIVDEVVVETIQFLSIKNRRKLLRKVAVEIRGWAVGKI